MKNKKYKIRGIVRANLILLILTAWICCSYAPDTASVEATRIKDNIYKLCVDDFVNLVAFVGPDGVLLVDSGFRESSEQVKSILKDLGGSDIKYIINTHSDYDHIAGNSALRENAVVLAHTLCKSQLIEYSDPEYDAPFDKSLFLGAYPTITFEEPITLDFNGYKIQIFPIPGGHTDEDVIVYFKNSGVVCLGDMILPGSFPVVKIKNGGSPYTLLENVEKLISLFPEDVIFIVGHGEDTTVKELRIYHEMLQSTIATVQAAMKANMSVEEMKRREILDDWSSFNNPKNEETTAEAWIETIYRSSVERTNEIKDPILKGTYFGQKPPGMTPELFAPELLDAEHGYHSTVIFSPYLTEAVWSPMEREPALMYSKMVNGTWTSPQKVNFGFKMGVGDAAFSPDGNRLYFLSFQPPQSGAPEKERIWFVERTEDGWSEPALIDEVILAHPTHWTFSLAKNGNLYFTSEIEGVRGEQDIYVSRFDGEKYLPPEDLGEAINSNGKDLAPFIAPDESYLIFTRIGKDTKKTDLFVSFKNSEGHWINAVDMGDNINTEHHDLCASVSPDSKYMFFLSQRDGKNRIYWVDARIIDLLKSDLSN